MYAMILRTDAVKYYTNRMPYSNFESSYEFVASAVQTCNVVLFMSSVAGAYLVSIILILSASAIHSVVTRKQEQCDLVLHVMGIQI